MNMFNIAIFGVGKLGGALALALTEKKYHITELISRKYENAKEIANQIKPTPRIILADSLAEITADIIFITTQDSEISKISEDLAEKIEHLPYVFHVSGALSSKVLYRLNDEGCDVGSIHPLVSISDAKMGAKKFKDAYFCVEGDFDAVEIGKQIVKDLEGFPFSIDAKYKPLYHASAVMACGHLTALVSASIELLSNCGLSKEESQKILMPLIQSTTDNLSLQTPIKALTGTFARADVETLQKHLKIIQEINSVELLEIYRQLGLHSLPLAKEQGTDISKIEQMREILNVRSQG